jgi:hypothetical protein
MMIRPAEYSPRLYTAGQIIILETEVNNSLQSVGGCDAGDAESEETLSALNMNGGHVIEMNGGHVFVSHNVFNAWFWKVNSLSKP